MSGSAHPFASQIPGLHEIAPSYWLSETHSAVSYPEAGHASAAAVEANSYWFNHRNRLICSVVSQHPPQGDVVDIGGGNGYVSLGLTQAGFPCVVAEPGQSGAECARGRNLPVIRAAFESLAVPDGAISAAGLFDVLEHIEDDAGALHALHRQMAHGGMLYLTVPTFQWLWSAEDVSAGHFRRYSLTSVSHLLEACGFSVRFATYFFAMLVPPIFAARTVPTVLGLSKAAAQGVAEADHLLPGGALGKTLSALMSWEQRRVDAGRRVPFGSSCLVVARRH